MNFFSRRDFTLSLVIESDLQLNRANDSDIHCNVLSFEIIGIFNIWNITLLDNNLFYYYYNFIHRALSLCHASYIIKRIILV